MKKLIKSEKGYPLFLMIILVALLLVGLLSCEKQPELFCWKCTTHITEIRSPRLGQRSISRSDTTVYFKATQATAMHYEMENTWIKNYLVNDTLIRIEKETKCRMGCN